MSKLKKQLLIEQDRQLKEDAVMDNALSQGFPEFKCHLLINKIRTEAMGIKNVKLFNFSNGETLN